MKHFRLEDYTRGWVIGDFEPSVIKTTAAEISVREYAQGDHEPRHVHKEADELTIVVSGKVTMNGAEFGPNDMILIDKNESTDFTAIEKSVTCVIKVPSVIGDKYQV